MFSRKPLLALLLCSVLAASCATTPATESRNMTLKVAFVSNSISFFPFYVAQQKAYFTSQGLTLDPAIPPVLGTGPKVADAIETGSIEVAGESTTDAFTISRVDAGIRMVGTFANDYLLDIVVSKRFEEQTHLSAASPLAEKVKALVGRKIGIASPNSAGDALVTYLLKQQGFSDQRDVTKVFLGSTSALTGLGALAQGRVDAISFAVPAGQVVQAKGIGDIFISPVRGDVPPMQGQLYGVVFAKQQVITSKPKAIQAFIRALAQAETWIHKNPNQARALLATYLKLDPNTTNTIWSATLPSMPMTPQISQQAFETADQFHVDAGLIALKLSYNDLVDADTMNNALKGLK
ncbi:ABC transporter substrate-binding protein [Ktedonosporobacter rubrisoli]|uniref:ABC transporter substrate-binding protein n=1 Tax=Ktedonosporobacter rubrisoli TaxID=2509675 RepID=A0A4V0Z048_KTERU|nr:ABC transporter substrate-binding protein [Ktedonosporobacter rubrisoli]QBD81971.1 ABC transporter substrate-binding protein [Ktedonosporobacter rubrisoli]